jgi:hypothetical protein
METTMVRNARLLIAGVLLLGATSLASAQSWQYDQTPDDTLSYGPKHPSAARGAAAGGLIGQDAYNQFDGFDDKTLSYGVPAGR